MFRSLRPRPGLDLASSDLRTRLNGWQSAIAAARREVRSTQPPPRRRWSTMRFIAAARLCAFPPRSHRSGSERSRAAVPLAQP
jgi:hypothetical protein